MTHHQTIKSLIEPYIGEETKVLPKFLHYILSDPKYGSINQTKDKKSTKAIQGVIDLYETWINTGIKPSKEIWLKAKEDAWADAADAWAAAAWAAWAAWAADAAYAAYAAYAAAYAAYAAADADADAGIPRSEVEKAQIDKLNELINENKISFKDETPNQIIEFLTNSLKSFGYSVVKTEELDRLMKLEEDIFSLTSK